MYAKFPEFAGDLYVDTIDGIMVSEIVFKSGRMQQEIEGVKTFSGGLHVVGETQAPVVNGINILDLNNNVVRKDRAATITKELVSRVGKVPNVVSL